MRSRRFIAFLALAFLSLAIMVMLATVDAGDPPVPPPPSAGVAPSGTHVGTPAPSATPAASTPTTAASSADVLEAVRTLKHLCDVVDDGDRDAARRLLAGPWVWPRAELTRIARLRLVSARLQKGGVAGQVVLLGRVRARLRGPSPLHDGVNTLFFTLGRDGTTGGWLVTAVTTSP